MNFSAHARIMTAGYDALPQELREMLPASAELLAHAGNYPDYFDDPTAEPQKKQSLDAEWERYCVFPPEMKARALHFWPDPLTDQNSRRQLLEYYLNQMVKCCRMRDADGFIKFSGCLSHLFGDTTQPAHLDSTISLDFVRELLPRPTGEEFRYFHYHTDIEKVTGECASLAAPSLQGTSVPEAAWRISRRCLLAISHCREFIVPILQALFRKDMQAAEQAASEPVTIAAQLTADAMYTAALIATDAMPETQVESLNNADLRVIRPDTEFHDLVYSGAMRDSNRKVPPNNGPLIAGKLRFADGIRELPGLGVLPHSGMSGPRESRMIWRLPAFVFRRFTAVVGLHPELAEMGAVSFSVLCDGKAVWESGRMTVADLAQPVEVDFAAASELCLLVQDANNGTSFWHNHAYWGRPLLSK